MTAIAFILAAGTGVPVLMFLVAMLCDTAMIVTYLLVKGVCS